MDSSTTIRLIFVGVLAMVAQFQFALTQQTGRMQMSQSQPSYLEEIPIRADLDHPLPILNRTIPTGANVEWAIHYLRLPVWSSSYLDCDAPESEVSCYEIYLSAKIIEHWERSLHENSTTGLVWVNDTGRSVPEKLSMLYHGFQIAISTNRKLVTCRDHFAVFDIPNSIGDLGVAENGTVLPDDYRFACTDISLSSPNLVVSAPIWPQVLYIHPYIGKYLRTNFGYHAAYFMGNFLFGSAEEPSFECFSNDTLLIDGSRYHSSNDMMSVHEYGHFLVANGINASMHTMITNVENVDGFHNVHFLDGSDQSVVCGLRKLMSGRKIVQTLGSGIGFWATAMVGAKGAFINPIDRILVNLTNSQQGSLWHMRSTSQQSGIYRASDWFYICGENAEDANLYFDYLLW
jgi:hypothetical protein